MRFVFGLYKAYLALNPVELPTEVHEAELFLFKGASMS